MDYPRPQLRRAAWTNLDGAWQFAFDNDAAIDELAQVRFDRTIQVPYAPEAPNSGIGDTDFHRRVWYRRAVDLDGGALGAGERVIVHFGAVDYAARVYVDGAEVGTHRGGHVPFSIDVTRWIKGTRFELAVRADDDPADMQKPRGKQDWKRDPHSIWYPRTTGIWRTVWLERVSASRIEKIKWQADVARWEIRADLRFVDAPQGGSVRVKLSKDGRTVVDDTSRLDGDELSRVYAIASDFGIDDGRDDWMWSPEHPQLIDAELELRDADGRVVDRVESYTALRSVWTDGERFMLNNRPYTLRMVLDQGYWRDGLMTADSARLRHDVEMIKKLGFNGARKHQKAEDPRWLYWCDVLGLAVWGEMPSAYGFGDRTVSTVVDEWQQQLERDISHPCIVAWVPINESWGVPDLPHSRRQVALVKALYELTHAIDGSRPVVGNDGWEMPCGDLVNIHDYHHDPAVIAERYVTRDAIDATLASIRPSRRRLLTDGFDPAGRPVLLTEFGGIACITEGEGWGYSIARSGDELLARYAALLAAIHQCTALSGFCYTQLTDTFLEKNGLLTETREPKADLVGLARATLGEAAAARRDFVANSLGYSDRWLAKPSA
ncbi:glycoside hydrolase family 2 protein [Pararobbsia silviterrae]|uniref:Glycoside hydrolase family 2 n=1 Tax=Pararobbsia silviterrae TaxID=1792498 RepID=A0A494YGD2_9BURK|nr:glycoside hydrolase family 2 TIM barrel-domain containing protein [Pararobbsia silviterrae]RKP59097.1 glycoside hydrolase family 2 [Pararobbsia silviterrae]